MRTMDIGTFSRRLQEMLSEQDCRLVWFFGAGCSIGSGIPGAAALVELWAPRLKKREVGSEVDWREWLEGRFTDYDPDDLAKLYGVVLEELFPLPHERQQEVERLTSEKDPSIGYALFAVLAAHEEFGPRSNIVLTTNFDDLVSDAVYLMTRKKPLVVSHDSLAPFVRASRSRPLIVKVHGDARLAPRNTVAETSALDLELSQRVSTLFAGCALIFVGYGGNDVSIRHLLESAPVDSFPLGIYWVGSEPPSATVGDWLLERAATRNDVFHVDHRSFDGLFLRLREVLNLQLPDGSRLTELFESYSRGLERRGSETGGSASRDEKEIADRARKGLDAVRLITRARNTDTPTQVRGELYRQAVEVDPNSALVLAAYAVFLSQDLKDFDRAETMYERAVAADPDGAGVLGSYALFLDRDREDFDRAEAMYERAINADPDRAANLGNYAHFLTYDRKDFDRAEAMYERAIAAGPDDANNLGNYAAFLSRDRRDLIRAETMYQRAIAADPDHANNLGNYAHFLARDRKDLERAGAMYERAIAADPDHANNLSNYALFLARDRKDPERAEAMYERAIAANASDANTLGNYAVFLARDRKDPERADAVYRRAIAADPHDANNLSNYLQMRWQVASDADNESLLAEARELSTRSHLEDALYLELIFYILAHSSEVEDDLARQALDILRGGGRSAGWSFEPDLTWAERHGRPDLDFLRALARVITADAPLDELREFSRWRDLL